MGDTHADEAGRARKQSKQSKINQWTIPGDAITMDAAGRERDYQTAEEKRHEEVMAALELVAAAIAGVTSAIRSLKDPRYEP